MYIDKIYCYLTFSIVPEIPEFLPSEPDLINDTLLCLSEFDVVAKKALLC